MLPRLVRVSLFACLLVLAAALAACGGDGSTSTTSQGSSTSSASGIGVSASTCTDVEYGGSGSPDAVIVSDLPMQGDSAERSKQQVEAIKLALNEEGWKAGDL